MDEETIYQLRALLSSTKERLSRAYDIIFVCAPSIALAQNYVEKHQKEIDDLKYELGETQTCTTFENEPPIGQSHDANGRLV